MGAKNKGADLVVVTSRRSTTIAFSKVASIVSPIFKGGMEHLIIQTALASLPHWAPLILAAYFVFRYGWAALHTYREYRELRKKVSETRALRLEAERTGLRQLAGIEGDQELDNYIQTKVAHLVGEREIRQAIEKAFPDSTSTDTRERFKLMLQRTLSDFLIGAAHGGKGKLVDAAAKQFFK
jgi:hypothetical protein